jgi:hypothetical protein
MERIYDKSSCWRADKSLQHTLLVADNTLGTSLQPTTTGNTPYFAALDATTADFNILVVCNNSGH